MEDKAKINIKKTIFRVDEKRTYNIDVDATVNFFELKKILASAAHLPRNGFRIYHEGEDYTDNYEEETLFSTFPDLNEIIFDLRINAELIDETEENLISVKLNLNQPCETHINKFKMLYCINCKKSICSECQAISHRTHEVKEKADYLIPAKYIMSRIFYNSNAFRTDPRLSTYIESVNLRTTLKDQLFANLRNLLNELEQKCTALLEFYGISEDTTEKNTNSNIDLLHKYCIESFIQLKNDIYTKGIIIDDEIFLAIYQKLKEVEKYKNEYFELNKLKYEKINSLLAPYKKLLITMTEEISSYLNHNLNQEFFQNLRTNIESNIVELITKEKVVQFMFSGIEVPRRSVNRNVFYQAKFHYGGGRKSSTSVNNSLNLSMDALAKGESHQKIIEDRVARSAMQNTNINKTELPGFSNFKGEREELRASRNTISGIENITRGGVISQNNITSFTNETGNLNANVAFDTNSNVNTKVTRTTNVTNTNVTNVNDNNNNLITGNNLTNSNKVERNISMTQEEKRFDLNNLTGFNSLTQSNVSNNVANNVTGYTLTQTTNNVSNNLTKDISGYGALTQTTNNVSNNALNERLETTFGNERISNTQVPSGIITQKVTTTTTTYQTQGVNNIPLTQQYQQNTINEQSHIHNTQQTQQTQQNEFHSFNLTQQPTEGLFGKKLVEAISDEISKNERQTQQQNLFGNNINEKKTEIFHTTSNEGNVVVNKTVTTETVVTHGNIGNTVSSEFLFMYPVTKTNKVKGAYDEELCEDVEIDFSKVFNSKDMQLKQFPEGGAYCNHDNNLYFSGGQEFLKGLGKIFLRITVDKNDKTVKMVKMPQMNNSRWNHSMIYGNNYIFVVGGYGNKKVEAFDLKTSKWQNMHEMNYERQRPMLFIYNNYLYAFMGYDVFRIFDTVERINIKKVDSGRWELVKIKNPQKINLKFYGAGIFKVKDKNTLYFIGGKIGQGDDENIDYKSDIYEYDLNNNEFDSKGIGINGKLVFVENQLYSYNNDSGACGNFIDKDEGCLVSIPEII